VGAAAVANAQSDELAASGHGTGDWAARCTDCHDPHSGALRLPETDNTLCLSCHAGLDFADESAIKQHTGHPVYQPEERPGAGRCTGCHMPETAARLLWRDETGAGDLASHRFLAISPQATLDDFDSAGVDTLSAGDFTPNACASCHAWNEWLFDGWFPGPSGAPTDRATHEALLEAYEEIWP
jgi:predicted CXXCH cytochrome family protein